MSSVTRAWVAASVAWLASACTKVVITPPDHGQGTDRGVTIAVVAGNNQSGAPGQVLSVVPTVRVTHADGTAAPDLTVIFSPSFGGAVQESAVRTDANGVAAAGRWTLGPVNGMQTLTASLPGVASVSFVATASSGGQPNPPSPSADRVIVPFRPFGVATSSAGLIYATQLDGRSITRVSFGSTTTNGAVAVGNAPTDVAFDPTGATAVVTNQFDPSIGIIDVASGRQVQTFTTGTSTFRAIVAPDGHRAYATEAGGALLVIDLASRTTVGSTAVAPTSNGLAFGLGDTLLYVASMTGKITVVDVKRNAALQTFTIPGVLQDITLSPDRATIYVAREDGSSIAVVNAATGAVVSQIDAHGPTFGLVLAPDGRSLYATQPQAGRVVVLDRLTGATLRIVSVGGTPRRIAFDPKSGRAVVSNEAGWLDYIQ